MKKWLTTVEAARKLGVGRATIYRWMDEKKIKSAVVMVNGELLFKPVIWTDEELRKIKAWMKSNYIKGRGKRKA